MATMNHRTASAGTTIDSRVARLAHQSAVQAEHVLTYVANSLDGAQGEGWQHCRLVLASARDLIAFADRPFSSELPATVASFGIDAFTADQGHDATVEAEQHLCEVIGWLTTAQPDGWMLMREMLIRARQLTGFIGQAYACELPNCPERAAASVGDLAWDVVGAQPA